LRIRPQRRTPGSAPDRVTETDRALWSQRALAVACRVDTPSPPRPTGPFPMQTPPAVAAGPAWYRAARIGLSLSPLILVHLALLATPFVPATLLGLVVLVAETRLTGLGVTVGFHRFPSHHAFKTSRCFQVALAA